MVKCTSKRVRLNWALKRYTHTTEELVLYLGCCHKKDSFSQWSPTKFLISYVCVPSRVAGQDSQGCWEVVEILVGPGRSLWLPNPQGSHPPRDPSTYPRRQVRSPCNGEDSGPGNPGGGDSLQRQRQPVAVEQRAGEPQGCGPAGRQPPGHSRPWPGKESLGLGEGSFWQHGKLCVGVEPGPGRCRGGTWEEGDINEGG